MRDRIRAGWILALLTVAGFSIREIRKRHRDRKRAAGAAWQSARQPSVWERLPYPQPGDSRAGAHVRG